MTKDEHPHPSEEELFDCSEQRASSEVNAHVAACVSCAAVVSDYRDIAAAARNPETWRLADEIMRAAASDTIAADHLQVIRRVAALKEAEDAQANALLAGKLEPSLRTRTFFGRSGITPAEWFGCCVRRRGTSSTAYAMHILPRCSP